MNRPQPIRIRHVGAAEVGKNLATRGLSISSGLLPTTILNGRAEEIMDRGANGIRHQLRLVVALFHCVTNDHMTDATIGAHVSELGVAGAPIP